MQKVRSLFQKHKELILYVIFGGLTTLVNYVVYFLCKAVGLSYSPATVIAWIVAVGFAYIVNRVWVFASKSRGVRAVLREIILFVGARLFSLVLELGVMFVGMDLLGAGRWVVSLSTVTLPLGEFLTKTVAQILVVLSNYVFSKLVIFRKRRSQGSDSGETHGDT